MTFGGEIKRTPMNRENLSESVHFISNHCYIKLHNKVVGAKDTAL
jgi:hypothetical protein